MSAPSGQDRKIDSLQALRGVAAILVAGYHLKSATVDEGFAPGLFALFSHGTAGVDIFFVISGFIIYYIAASRPRLTAPGFLAARFWRIFPPYWGALTLYILMAVGLWLVLSDPSKLPSLRSLVISYLLLPNLDYALAVAWTLSIECLFYGLLAATFFRFGAGVFLATLIGWVVLAQVSKHVGISRGSWLFLPLHPTTLELLLGVLIALLHLRGITRFQPLCLALGVAGLAAYLAGWVPMSREFAAGIPAALLVYGALGWRRTVPRALMFLGEASYLLYLIHIPIYSLIGRGVESLTGFQPYGSDAAMLGMLGLAITISCLATMWLERPYQRWYRQRLRR